MDLLSSMLTYSFVYTNDVYQPDDEEPAGGLPAGPGGHCRHLPPGIRTWSLKRLSHKLVSLSSLSHQRTNKRKTNK